MSTKNIWILAAVAIATLLTPGPALALTVEECRGCHGTPPDGNTWGIHHNLPLECTVCHRTPPVNIYDCFSCHIMGSNHPDCLDCHSAPRGTRRAVSPEFSMASHHIQTATPTRADCEACHDTSAHKQGTVRLRVTGGGSPVAYTDENSATPHCLSCHNESSKTAVPFGDGRTPVSSMFNWDNNSIDLKYSSTEVVSSNKYPPTATAPKMGQPYNTVPDVRRALSAHGNPVMNLANGGGLDRQVPCLSCHNSHGSPAAPLLYSKGTYTPSSLESFCWDCHNNEPGVPRVAGDFLSLDTVKDYWGGPRWGMNDGTGFHLNLVGTFPTKNSNYLSSHFYPSKRGSGTNWPRSVVNCTDCHDPHGVAPNGTGKAYMVPLLKGTWLVSPYKEDRPPLSSFASPLRDQAGRRSPGDQPRSNPDLAYNNTPVTGGGYLNGAGEGHEGYFIDENTFGIYNPITNQPAVSGSWASVLANNQTLQINRITETDNTFGGLCLTCHPKTNLITSWSGHKVVKGWGGATRDLFPRSLAITSGGENQPSSGMHAMGRYARSSAEEGFRYARGYRWGVNPKAQQTSGYIQADYHQFPCSKCHSPHATNLPRLMVTNCLDSAAGRTPYPLSQDALANNCHSTERGLAWNTVTPTAQGIYTITSSAGTGGSITPLGTIDVNQGANQTFTITPDFGYQIANVVVDGASQGAIASYTFSNVTAGHLISAAFSPVNLALNKPATASSTRSGTSYTAAKAVDGSTSTSWMSSTTSGAQWVRVDLGASKYISNVKVAWPATYYARAFQIQTSSDGTNWTTRYTTTTGNGSATNATFLAVAVRYVRVYCTTPNNSSYYGVAELEVYGTDAPNQPPVANAGPDKNGTPGTPISFTGTGTDADGTVVSYSWNWGDTTADTEAQNASHTYAAAGTYTATLTVTDDWGDSGFDTAVVTVSTGSPVNLALNKLASASSTRSGTSYTAAKAVDGSTSTSWMSSTTSGAQWVRVDLGSSYTISNVKVFWPATYYAKRFQIQTSTDGTNWTTRYTTPSDANGTPTNVTFAPVAARYVRVYCTTRNNSSYYGVSEMEVYQ